MITLDVFSPVQISTHTNMNGLNRVFSAAVVSRTFCETLLHAPEQALTEGYLGQPFLLTEQEKMLITSIRAESLPDLARQVRRALSGEL